MDRAGEKLLLFGGKPAAYLENWEITSDLVLAERVMGVRFEEVSHEDLVARYASPSEDELDRAQRLARDLLEGASGRRKRSMPAPPPLPEVEKATRLYVAMRHFIQERAAQAVTVGCGPWIGGADLPTPCVALMLLQEEGVPAACQGDVDALLTMVLFKRIAGLSSFMGGAVKARGHLGLSHCVLCRSMLGTDGGLQPYQVSTYHGRKETPTVWTQIPAGETVTVARLTRNLERLLLLKGPVVATDTHNHRCRNTVVVEVPDRGRVFRAVRGIQNHYAVACGDHVAALTGWADAKGVEVIRLDVLQAGFDASDQE